MIIDSLELEDFRNYNESHKVKFSPYVNILLGNNAQGKTNILESIYLLATTRSHRTQKNSELICFNKQKADIFIRSKSNRGKNYFNLQIRPDNSKLIYINGKKIKRSTDLLSFLNVVLFSPEDISLITGSPAVRRKFIDVFISQVKPIHAVTLHDYYKVLRQRNQTLKDIQRGKVKDDLLGIWDKQLVDNAISIVKARNEAINSLRVKAGEFYSVISDNKEVLDLEYTSSIFQDEKFDLKAYKDKLINKLNKNRKRDIYYGVTSTGPHRDDIVLKINDNDAKLFASQGQKRLISLALKYSEVGYIRDKTGEYPILLFDDVLLELDLQRKHNLLQEMLKKAQIIITTTDLKRYREVVIKEAEIFKIENGSISVGGK